MSKLLYMISAQNTAGILLCLENNEDEISIVLLQNAVYCATKQCKEIKDALEANKKVYALKEDVELRGIQDLLLNGVSITDYSEVIDLVFDHDTIVNF